MRNKNCFVYIWCSELPNVICATLEIIGRYRTPLVYLTGKIRYANPGIRGILGGLNQSSSSKFYFLQNTTMILDTHCNGALLVRILTSNAPGQRYRSRKTLCYTSIHMALKHCCILLMVIREAVRIIKPFFVIPETRCVANIVIRGFLILGWVETGVCVVRSKFSLSSTFVDTVMYEKSYYIGPCHNETRLCNSRRLDQLYISCIARTVNQVLLYNVNMTQLGIIV